MLEVLPSWTLTQFNKMWLVHVRHKAEDYAMTPTGWLEKKLAKAERYRKDAIREAIHEIKSKIGQAIWEARHYINGVAEDIAQIELDYGIRFEEKTPTPEELVNTAWEHVEFEH